MSTYITRENNITFRLADGKHIPESCIDSMCRTIAMGVPDDELDEVLCAIKAQVGVIIPALFQGFYINGDCASFVFGSTYEDRQVAEMSELREKILSAKPYLA